MASLNVIAAESADHAQQQFRNALRFRVRSMVARSADVSDEEIDAFLAGPRGRGIADMVRYTAAGTAVEVAEYIDGFAESARLDEVLTAPMSLDADDRLASVRLTGEVLSQR